MPIIYLETHIKASIDLCFDLSRSIDLHSISVSQTKEKAVAGVTTGLIELNGFVTWEAVHFGIKQRLTSKITAFNRPFHFRDEQLKGAFKSIKHDHYFESKDGYVLMKDYFNYESPFGVLDKVFNTLVLTNYLKKFLIQRNKTIKEFAETDKWKLVLNEKILGE